jgi:O-antigen ligase
VNSTAEHRVVADSSNTTYPDMLTEASENSEPGVSRGRFESFAFKCALVLVFLRFSVLPEILASLTRVDLYLLYFFIPIVVLGVVVSGGIRRTFREKTGKFWFCFLLWIFLAVPFSSWPGGSLAFANGYLKVTFVMLLAASGLARTWSDCRKIIYSVAAAAMVNVASAYFFRSGEDRLGFSDVSGSVGNPDDFAAHMLLVLPFVLFIVLKPGARFLIRLISVAVVGFGIFQILKTASRGALVALVLTTLLLFLRGSARQKVAIGAVAAATAVLIMVFLPPATWNRLTSFSKGTDIGAFESQEERQHLLEQSIIYTFQHPIFGVGPGQFSTYEGRTMRKEGHHGLWLGTHNSYTQISSECGIPELVFYACALVSTFGLLAKIRKTATGICGQEITTAAGCISIGLLAHSMAIAFVNYGFAYEVLTISGLVIAIWMVIDSKLADSSSEESVLSETAPDGSHVETVGSLGIN